MFTPNGTTPWSKRARNRIGNFLAAFQCHVPEILDVNAPSERELARIYEFAPQFVNAIVGGSTTAHIFEGAPGDLCAIAANHARERNEATLIMGVGGYDEMPSPRIAAILRPMLETATKIKQIGLSTPAIRIFKANHLAANVNGFDIARIRAVSSATSAFLHDYAATFFPGINVTFHTDETDAMLRCYGAEIAMQAATMELSEQLLAIGGTRSSPTDKRKYAVAHAYQLQCIHGYEELLEPSFESKSVIIYGGIAERCFVPTINECVKMEARLGKTPRKRVHVVHKTGRKPAYMPHHWEKRIGETILAKDTIAANGADIDTTSLDWMSFGDEIESFLDFCNYWRMP